MGVIEAPIQHADQHAITGVGLWQVDALLHAVGMDGSHELVQRGLRDTGQFGHHQSGDRSCSSKVVDIHPEGKHIAHTGTNMHNGRVQFIRMEGLIHLSEEAHHAVPAHHRHGVFALCGGGQFACIGLLLCQRL